MTDVAKVQLCVHCDRAQRSCTCGDFFTTYDVEVPMATQKTRSGTIQTRSPQAGPKPGVRQRARQPAPPPPPVDSVAQAAEVLDSVSSAVLNSKHVQVNDIWFTYIAGEWRFTTDT